MKKFLFGLSLFWLGGAGALITYVYTLFNQGTLNGQEGWIINFISNDTGIPLLIFIALMVAGGFICVTDMK